MLEDLDQKSPDGTRVTKFPESCSILDDVVAAFRHIPPLSSSQHGVR